jgi:hypothetical protein
LPTEAEKIGFSLRIEELSQEKQCSLFEAMLLYSEEHDVEESVIASLIHIPLQVKLEEEMRGLNLIKGKKPKQLPF